MKTEEDYKLVQAMETFGGSFVKALAEACRHADPNNFRILRNAFDKYFEEYKKFTK